MNTAWRPTLVSRGRLGSSGLCGSGVVHAVGGFVALAGAMLVEPRNANGIVLFLAVAVGNGPCSPGKFRRPAGGIWEHPGKWESEDWAEISRRTNRSPSADQESYPLAGRTVNEHLI